MTDTSQSLSSRVALAFANVGAERALLATGQHPRQTDLAGPEADPAVVFDYVVERLGSLIGALS